MFSRFKMSKGGGAKGELIDSMGRKVGGAARGGACRTMRCCCCCCCCVNLHCAIHSSSSTD